MEYWFLENLLGPIRKRKLIHGFCLIFSAEKMFTFYNHSCNKLIASSSDLFFPFGNISSLMQNSSTFFASSKHFGLKSFIFELFGTFGLKTEKCEMKIPVPVRHSRDFRNEPIFVIVFSECSSSLSWLKLMPDPFVQSLEICFIWKQIGYRSDLAGSFYGFQR